MGESGDRGILLGLGSAGRPFYAVLEFGAPSSLRHPPGCRRILAGYRPLRRPPAGSRRSSRCTRRSACAFSGSPTSTRSSRTRMAAGATRKPIRGSRRATGRLMSSYPTIDISFADVGVEHQDNRRSGSFLVFLTDALQESINCRLAEPPRQSLARGRVPFLGS